MQVTNHSNNKRKMKEELLEAIYGTVERLEQKVDELSVSTKNAGAETVPASNDITKLDKSINAMFIKEEEVRDKISKLRDDIVVFGELYKNGAEWKFNAIGSGYQGGLTDVLRQLAVGFPRPQSQSLVAWLRELHRDRLRQLANPARRRSSALSLVLFLYVCHSIY